MTSYVILTGKLKEIEQQTNFSGYLTLACVVARYFPLAKCDAIIALSNLPRERLDLWLFTLSSLQTPGAIQSPDYLWRLVSCYSLVPRPIQLSN